MNKIILLLALLVLTGCDIKDQDQYTARKRPANNYEILYSEACINGVVYYVFSHGMSPAFNTYSQVITCPTK